MRDTSAPDGEETTPPGSAFEPFLLPLECWHCKERIDPASPFGLFCPKQTLSYGVADFGFPLSS